MGSIFGGGKSGGFQAQGPSQAQVKTSFNQSQDSIAQQKAFVDQLQAQNGLGNQQDVFAQQQALANQIQGVANGTGPNPALAQLNQATGQNISNQAAMQASQRGASANTGLIARQAGQQGGQIQQQAAGQAATLQAQQQIAAMGQLQGQQSNMANLANTQVGQTQQGLANYGQQTGQQYSSILGGQANANSANAAIAQTNAQAGNNLLGNIAGAVGTAFAGPIGGLFAKTATDQVGQSGPQLKFKAEGGAVEKSGPKSKAGQHVMSADSGKLPLMVSPGEKILSPKEVAQAAKDKNPMAKGKEVPGKAKVGGAKDSYSNDTVRVDAEPGSIVIPRSITQAKDPHKAAADFVAAVLARKGLRK